MTVFRVGGVLYQLSEQDVTLLTAAKTFVMCQLILRKSLCVAV